MKPKRVAKPKYFLQQVEQTEAVVLQVNFIAVEANEPPSTSLFLETWIPTRKSQDEANDHLAKGHVGFPPRPPPHPAPQELVIYMDAQSAWKMGEFCFPNTRRCSAITAPQMQ